MEKLTISELESCINLNQFLIDDVIRKAKMNGNTPATICQVKLNKLNRQRDIIINLIENKLDEICTK